MKNVLNKSVYLVNFWLLLTVAVFNSCGIKNNEEGVIINGIKWATRNVDTPGTFAAKPEDPGMFYQWNRKEGWSVTDPLQNSSGGTEWDDSMPADDTWEKSNNPCPAGWRVPSWDEMKKLLDEDNVTSEWTTVNGVNGKRFIDKVTGNSLFLPAAGSRGFVDGSLYDAGAGGYYWSSTVYGTSSYSLYFDSSDVYPDYNTYRAYGLSCRCISE